MTYEISLSTGGLQKAYGDFAALDIAKAAGADAVDFSTEYYNYLEKYSIKPEHDLYRRSEDEVASYFESVKKYADSIGLRICQTHARIKGYNYDEEHNGGELCGMRYDVMAAKLLGAPYAVVHNVHLGLDAPAEDQRFYNDRMWNDYLPIAKKDGIILATETFGDAHAPDGRCGIDFFGDETEFVSFYKAFSERDGNAPYFCTCVDTGHTNKAHRFEGQPTAEAMIRKLGSSVKCLHLNDNDSFTDQHLVPLAGTVDWQAVMTALADIGYSGVYNMELNLHRFGTSRTMRQDYAEFAVKVMRTMLQKYCG